MKHHWLGHKKAVDVLATLINQHSVYRKNIFAKPIEKVIGLVGSAGLGKTSFAKSLCHIFSLWGIPATHVQLDGFIHPRECRQGLDTNGYELEGWNQDIAEMRLRLLLLKGECISIPEYLSTGIHGKEHRVCPGQYICLDGNYCLLGPINELVDILIYFAADSQTSQYLRYERDVIIEHRFSPEKAPLVWEREEYSFQSNIKSRKDEALFTVMVNENREFSILETPDVRMKGL